MAPIDCVSIIGTGDFGRALAIRLVKSNIRVTFGCRNPQRRGNLTTIHESLGKCKVSTTPDAIKDSDLIVIAMHAADHPTLRQHESLLTGKIVIDVSNAETITNGESNTERLSKLLPKCKVVKAFNTVSTYSLESDLSGETMPVSIAGSCAESRQKVFELVRFMGLDVVDCGGLEAAKGLETNNLTLFKTSSAGTKIGLIIWVLWALYAPVRYYYLRATPYTWERLMCNVINKVFATTAITLLALCYLPGSFAAILQLQNGTKHKRFPDWLDQWLKMRKTLGLWAFFNGVFHMILSITMLNSAYYPSWFLQTAIKIPSQIPGEPDVSIPVDSRMTWNGEICVLLGALTVAAMSLQAITSLPEVGKRLNWIEWAFVQTDFGYWGLAFATLHTTIRGAVDWVVVPWLDMLEGMTFICLLIPYTTLILKLVLMLPCFAGPLYRIRHGWERDEEENDTEKNKGD